MALKDPNILYDYQAFRLLSAHIEQLRVVDIAWPLIKYGKIITAPASKLNDKLDVLYSLQFLSSGSARIEIAFQDPFTYQDVKQVLESNLYHSNENGTWLFECPVKTHKNCQIRPSLWLGKLGKFACIECARVRRYSKTIERYIAVYRKTPSLIVSTLTNPSSPETQKKWAYIALEKVSKRFKKMTLNYEHLNHQEKIYYGRLRSVLYPAKSIKQAFRPSKTLEGNPVPFQKLW